MATKFYDVYKHIYSPNKGVTIYQISVFLRKYAETEDEKENIKKLSSLKNKLTLISNKSVAEDAEVKNKTQCAYGYHWEKEKDEKEVKKEIDKLFAEIINNMIKKGRFEGGHKCKLLKFLQKGYDPFEETNNLQKLSKEDSRVSGASGAVHTVKNNNRYTIGFGCGKFNW